MNPDQFPIRRGEPTCQYYLKHGTCKFGQACKFHHPPQSELAAAVMGGSAVVMNVGRTSARGSGQQIVLNSVDGSTGTAAMALQFLPQRPDEPDCIYFLRNGRCKYGATCRYHHPVAFAQTKTVAAPTQARRQPSQRPPDPAMGMGARVRSSSSLQMASESIHSSRSLQGYALDERRGESTPTHFVVTETPLAVVAGSSTAPSTSYHRAMRSNSLGEDYAVPLNSSSGAGYPGRDYNSSSSSVSSSYETLPLTSELHGDSNGVVWPRPVKRIGSAGSLSAYDTTPPLRSQPATYVGNRTSLAPSVSDNSIASRQFRTESVGSASDQSAGYPDAWNQNAQGSWVEAASSRPRNMQGHVGGDRRIPQDNTGRMEGRTQIRDQRRESGASQDDGGLSMMTSALLSMMDTPEEVATKSNPSDHSSPSRFNPISPPTTPRAGQVGYPQDRESLPLEERYLGSPAIARHQEKYSQVVRGGAELQNSRYGFTSNEYEHDIATEHNDSKVAKSAYPRSPRSSMQDSSSRDHPSKAHPTNASVGLYLP